MSGFGFIFNCAAVAFMAVIVAAAVLYPIIDGLRTVDWTPPELEAMRRREEAAREILNRRDDRRVGDERRSAG